MCVLRQQRSCTCHNFRDCIAIKRPQHMRCDPTPVDASKSVHSGQMCSMLHSIPWKEGKQCRDLQLSKLCFCCMRHPKLLLLWLPTVCGVFITLCPVMGVFGPATGACRSWTPHLDRPFCVFPLLGLQSFDWKLTELRNEDLPFQRSCTFIIQYFMFVEYKQQKNESNITRFFI